MTRAATRDRTERETTPSRFAIPSPATTIDRLPRFAITALFVLAWMAIGWLLQLGAVAYLLSGIPLTIAFQALVARRPIPSLWIADAKRIRLDRIGTLLALGLAALPMYATAVGLTSGRILDIAYGLVGVVGAGPAAVALRAMDPRAWRALIRSMLTAGVVGAVLFVADHLIRNGPTIADPPAAVQAFVISLLLYIPMVFIIEEVTFRGALDPYARGSRGSSDLPSAVFVSALWGLWHLPLIPAEDALTRLPITLGYHLVVGLLLTVPWRGSGNLAVPGITHALIDAVRDGLAAG